MFHGDINKTGIIKPLGFMRGVVDFLDRITYKRMTSSHDLESIFRLRRETYVHAGYLPVESSSEFSDELDLTPNVHQFGIFLDEKLAAAIRIHKIDKTCRSSCATGIFPSTIDQWVDQSLVLVDSSRNSCSLEMMSKNPALPLAVIRLAGMYATHIRADIVLSTVVKKHIGFYKKVIGATTVGEPAIYGDLKDPLLIYLLASYVEKERISAMTSRQFILSSAEERRSLFEGEGGVFVRSTAKQIIDGSMYDSYWS